MWLKTGPINPQQMYMAVVTVQQKINMSSGNTSTEMLQALIVDYISQNVWPPKSLDLPSPFLCLWKFLNNNENKNKTHT
jgi:hypothetical protein